MESTIAVKTCSICNKPLNIHFKKRIYCSPECRIALKEKRKKEKSVEKICLSCNNPFLTTYSKKKFCSPQCSSDHYDKIHSR